MQGTHKLLPRDKTELLATADELLYDDALDFTWSIISCSTRY